MAVLFISNFISQYSTALTVLNLCEPRQALYIRNHITRSNEYGARIISLYVPVQASVHVQYVGPGVDT